MKQLIRFQKIIPLFLGGLLIFLGLIDILSYLINK